MKRKIVLFTAMAAFLSISLSSFHIGMNGFNNAHPGAAPSVALTGIRIGSTIIAADRNCGSLAAGAIVGYPSCHTDAPSGTLNILVTIYETPTYATLHTVNGFLPGHTYGIRITGDNTVTAGNDTLFGFQCTLFGWHAGTTGPITPGIVDIHNTDVQIDTANKQGAIIVDQTQTLNQHGTSTNKRHFQASFAWTAPDASTTIDTVEIRTLLCAVDGDGTYNGDAQDAASAGPTRLHRSTTGLAEMFTNASFNTFPNPATNNINIQMNNLGEGGYVLYVYDVNGRRIVNRNIEVSGNTHTENIDMSAWHSGVYFAQVARYGQFRNISIVKQ